MVKTSSTKGATPKQLAAGGIGVLLMAVILIVVYPQIPTPTGGPDIGGDTVPITDQPRWEQMRTAWAICEASVKPLLQSPGTAKFPVIDTTQIAVQDSGRYVVRLHVDAQNEPGRVGRTDYRCQVRDSAGNWRLESIDRVAR